MTIRSILLAGCFVLTGLTVGAQDTGATTHYKHSVGIGAGFSTGYGLSYRFQPKKLGFQLNFAPYQDKETARYSAGLTFFYPLIPGDITSLFVYQGNHYYYQSYMVASPYPGIGDERETESYFNNGLGLGIEIIFAKRIGFNLMMGYAAYVNFTQVNITGEAGLYFKF